MQNQSRNIVYTTISIDKETSRLVAKLCKRYFSAKMQNINETYYDRLKSLEDRFDNLENTLKIEK